MTIELDGGNLTIQQGSVNKRQLLPESDLNFFINENRRLSYSFVKDANGTVIEMIVQLDGRETARAKKTK